jgi:hypothetical protein
LVDKPLKLFHIFGKEDKFLDPGGQDDLQNPKDSWHQLFHLYNNLQNGAIREPARKIKNNLLPFI